MIPEYLYRGDSDPLNRRLLRATINHYQVQTNLINGGVGRVISETPLLDLINQHVNYKWEKTHFLSFSSNEQIAFKYGLNKESTEFTNLDDYCSEHYSEEDDWNFAIVTLSTSKMNPKRLGKGVFECFYTPSLVKFQNADCKLILIDVLEALFDTASSIENAKRDSEWLVLPANIFYDKGQVEYSAILDIGHIGEIVKYISHS
jgi:hypothetical protein